MWFSYFFRMYVCTWMQESKRKGAMLVYACMCVRLTNTYIHTWCTDCIVLVAKWNRIECFAFIKRDHTTHTHTSYILTLVTMKREILFLLPTNIYLCTCTDTLYQYMHTDLFLSVSLVLYVSVFFRQYSFIIVHAVRSRCLSPFRSPSFVDSRAFSSYL